MLCALRRVRVSWGRLENFKCVDYFQIEYYEKSNMAATVKGIWRSQSINYMSGQKAREN